MGLSKSEYAQLRTTVNLALQDLHIQRQFPGFIYRRERGGAVWRGTLQPRSFSQQYRIAVRYKLSCSPTVEVISPALLPKAPHLWRDRTLCLYYPRESPWKRDMLIATTILPWTALWLYYYELWSDTGKWLGPSSHAHDRQFQGGSPNSTNVMKLAESGV